MHLKRKTIKKFWSVPRTGTKYIALPNHEKESSIPLIVIAREYLGIVKNKKELKKILNEKKIEINGRIVKETGFPVSLFDSVAIPSIKKYYKIILKENKFNLANVSEDEANKRIYKVVGKTMLPGKKIQLNLSNGRNIISNEKINSGEFVVINNKNGKIDKIIQLKKDLAVIVVKGKHMGVEGKLKEITKDAQGEKVTIESKEGELKINKEDIFAKDK